MSTNDILWIILGISIAVIVFFVYLYIRRRRKLKSRSNQYWIYDKEKAINSTGVKFDRKDARGKHGYSVFERWNKKK